MTVLLHPLVDAAPTDRRADDRNGEAALASGAPVADEIAADEPAGTSMTPAPTDRVERSVTALRTLAAIAVVAALWWAQVLLIPLVLSVLLSYILEPLVLRLTQWRIPRGAGVPIVMTMLLAGVGGTAYALRGEAVVFVNRIPQAAHTVSQVIRNLSRGTPGAMTRMQDAARELETAAAGARKTNDGVTAVRVEQPTFKWSDWLWSGSRSVMEFSAQMFAVLCLTYYLLASGDLYRRKIVRIVPTLSRKKVTVQILAEIDRQIERFLLARAAISVIVGVVFWIAFRLIGLENAGVWGVLAAVLFAIPIVGPAIVIAAAAIAAFVQFGSVGAASGVAGLGVAIGLLEGNVLTPWLMTRVGEMNAVAVFVSLLFWSWIWGVWGLLLAVPITAAVKAVCERITDFRAVAELLKE